MSYLTDLLTSGDFEMSLYLSGFTASCTCVEFTYLSYTDLRPRALPQIEAGIRFFPPFLLFRMTVRL